jgi:Arc/MetJ-type ribon-helix-helix transcriptional regulator
MYGMKKTTVYLPDEVKAGLERVAGETGRSEADLIRDAVRALLEGQRRPRPKVPLFDSGDPTLAERVEEELAGRGPLPGFGEQ